MVELRTQEQRLLSALESLGGKASVEQLIDACGFPDTAVMRTALTLQEKNYITIHAEHQNVIKLTAEGEQYAKNGLPERNLIRTVAALGGTADLQTAAKQAGIEPQFIQIALGWAIRKKWAIYTSENNTIRIAEPLLHQAFIPEGCDETLLKYLNDKSTSSAGRSKPRTKRSSRTTKKTHTPNHRTQNHTHTPNHPTRQKSSRRNQNSPTRNHPTYTRTHNHRQMAHHKTPKIQHPSTRSQNLPRKKTPLPTIPRRSPRKTRKPRLPRNDRHKR